MEEETRELKTKQSSVINTFMKVQKKANEAKKGVADITRTVNKLKIKK